MTDRRILVAKIATAHGIKGLVKLAVMVEDERILQSGHPLYTSETGDDSIKIELKNASGKHYLASVEGVNERNGAERLRHTEIWMDYAALPETAEDEYYALDLIGMDVQDTDGNAIGTVIDFQDFGAGGLIDVKPSEGGDSFYIPFADQYIVNVDEEARLITADLPEGLR